jgi:hypothetical protein
MTADGHEERACEPSSSLTVTENAQGFVRALLAQTGGKNGAWPSSTAAG